jgi:hypothetical protein
VGVNVNKALFKEHFIFRDNTGCLLFFRTRSNLFLVFSDSNNKCVYSCSSGTAKLGANKKKKTAVQSV